MLTIPAVDSTYAEMRATPVLAEVPGWRVEFDNLRALVIDLFLVSLAYYLALLNVKLVYGGNTGSGEFWLGVVRTGFGPAGPLWFLWLLLVFDGLVAPLYRVAIQPAVAFHRYLPQALDAKGKVR